MRKLGSKALSILRYLEKVGPENARGTSYYAGSWPALAKLREHGFIEPYRTPGGNQAQGSGVTDAGREYLAKIDQEKKA